MAGIFPQTIDGGQPNATIPFSYEPTNAPLNTAVLYYPTTCGVKLRPEVLNSILSEILCAVDSSGNSYDASIQCNLSQAIADLVAAATPVFNAGALLKATGAITAGAYVQGQFGVFEQDTSIVNAHLTKSMKVIILSASCRLYNRGDNTAQLGADTNLSVNGAPFVQQAFAGSQEPNSDGVGGIYYSGGNPNIFIIPASTTWTFRLQARWAINSTGNLTSGGNIVEGCASYLTIT